MTTWEPATDGDKERIRVLLDKLVRRGQSSPVRESDLSGLTKKRAGELLSQLREMLNETDR